MRPHPRQFPLELARSTYGLIATTGVILLEDPCGDVAVTHSPGLSILIFGRLVSGTTTLKVMYFRSGSKETNSTGNMNLSSALTSLARNPRMIESA